MLKNMDELLELAKRRGKRRIAVAAAASRNILEGLKLAEDLVHPLLVGDPDTIKQYIDEIGLNAEIIGARDMRESTYWALELVRKGEADLIMKGKVPTPDFLRAVLDKEKGLRTNRVLSHLTVLGVPRYHKLLFITDAGMNIRPDLEMKTKILRNAFEILFRLGYEQPKAAVLASIEQLHPDMPETLDAAALSKMADRGVFGNALVDGPLAFDLAISRESAEIKGVKSPVAGDADILLVHDVAAGNSLAKSMIYFGGAKAGGIILGAKAPVVLLSRADSPEQKLYSIAFALASL